MGRASREKSQVTLGVEQIAVLLGITARQVQNLVKASVLPPPVARGEYDAVGCVSAWAEYLASDRGLTSDLAEAKRRHWNARARLAELEAGKRDGSLIPVEELKRVVESFILVVRSRLVLLPRKMAVAVAPERARDAEAKLETEIRAVLEELANDKTCEEVLRGADALLGEDDCE